MSGLLKAFTDMDTAQTWHRVVIVALLLVGLLLAGMSDGPA